MFIFFVEVISVVNDYCLSLDKGYYTKEIKDLEKNWTKCIELKGDYVAK